MKQLEVVKRKLKQGAVYRRADLEQWSASVDRHLQQLMQEGVLEKLSGGMYYVPKRGAFGEAPAKDTDLVAAFLKDHRFLVTTPNEYNALGLGTTQLYNIKRVYNYRRHGNFKLGNRMFQFVRRPYVPERVTKEFLLVDLVNDLNSLEEDQTAVLENIRRIVCSMNKARLKDIADKFGKIATRKFFNVLLS
ncbi:hypothetical protein [Niabella hirudinis]|uniref:hypothetical protein n=1 Tax=Niabella hirudinis TaxID=1285929 RepID=UPI003EBB6E09